MDSLWFSIQNRLKNSVVQILATQGDFNIGQPYIPPEIRNVRGSGFLISSQGHILTNAHVVASLLSVSFRAEQSGGLDLRATLIGICPAKDVALLRCHEDDLDHLGDFEPLTFADDQVLKQMQSVMVAGYPLGRRLTFTSGVVSGYEAPESEATVSSQSYIQVDAPMNPGNSGGPLITLEGMVVGVNSAGVPSYMAQNTNFAIPSRVVLSVLRELFECEEDSQRSKVVTPATLGLTTQRVTDAHYAYVGIRHVEDHLGVMVKDILKGSSFAKLQPGDILRAIKFPNPYANAEDFDVESYRTTQCLSCDGDANAHIVITKTGMVKFLLDGEETSYTKDRRVSMQELLDTIPSGTMLTLEIWRRDRGVMNIKGPFKHQNVLQVVTLYPPFDDLDYVLFAGSVWIPLCANVIATLGDTKYISEYIPFERRYEPRLILSNVFPTAEIRNLDVNATETLLTLNELAVETPTQLRKVITKIMSSSEKSWRLGFKSGKLVILDKMATLRSDKEILETFKIPIPKFNVELYKRIV